MDGKVVDVKKIMHELEKAEKEKLSAEANVNAFKNSLSNMINYYYTLRIIMQSDLHMRVS